MTEKPQITPHPAKSIKGCGCISTRCENAQCLLILLQGLVCTKKSLIELYLCSNLTRKGHLFGFILVNLEHTRVEPFIRQC